MKKLLLIVLFAITFVSCKKDTEPSSINAPFNSSNNTIQVKFDLKIPIDFTRFIPCTNEWVNFKGELVGKVHLAETSDGPRFHLHGNTQSHYQNMQGVGLTSGNKYNFISQRIDVANYRNSESEPFTFRVTERLLITTPGGGNNFVMVVIVQLVRNGTGEVIISRQEEKVYCQ